MRQKHCIKNTLAKIFKYGSQDIFRIQNTMLIEKYDLDMNSIQKLKNEPVKFGN